MSKKIRIIGDIHGNKYDYELISSLSLNPDISGSIQLGDFGIGLGGGDYWHESINSFMLKNKARMIRGNHDHPARCKSEMVGYISDGTVEGDVMYIGGAWSIDNPVAPPGWYRRTPGLDWWDDEECSDAEFEQFFETYKTVKPRVMITHDGPRKVTYEMFWGSGFITGPVYPNRTSEWFDRFIDAHRPEFHFFGHWHRSMAYKHGNTTFVCLGELDTIDVDLSNSEQMHEAIYEKFKT